MSCLSLCISRALFFFFTDPPTTETYTLSLHDALPISSGVVVAQVPGATGLTAYAGHVVWSQLDPGTGRWQRSEEHTSELQSRRDLVCRLLLEKKKKPDGVQYQIAGSDHHSAAGPSQLR